MECWLDDLFDANSLLKGSFIDVSAGHYRTAAVTVDGTVVIFDSY